MSGFADFLIRFASWNNRQQLTTASIRAGLLCMLTLATYGQTLAFAHAAQLYRGPDSFLASSAAALLFPSLAMIFIYYAFLLNTKILFQKLAFQNLLYKDAWKITRLVIVSMILVPAQNVCKLFYCGRLLEIDDIGLEIILVTVEFFIFTIFTTEFCNA